MNLKKEKATALLAAQRACKILEKHFGKKDSIQVKSNKSLVSDADLEANNAIIKTIKKNFPDHSILSEETPFEDRKSDFRWIIDPLDGTHNFIHGIPLFGTSIALEYKGEIIIGVMQFPILKITAFAEKGRGAFVNGKKVRVSDKGSLDHSFILAEFGYSHRDEKIGFLQKFVNDPIDLRNFGSAIYHLLLIASGKCDGFVILSTKIWDVAAGFLLVTEAGGKITGLNGGAWNLNNREFVVSNNRLHAMILNYIT